MVVLLHMYLVTLFNCKKLKTRKIQKAVIVIDTSTALLPYYDLNNFKKRIRVIRVK
jgi:hypothetical protein